MAVAWCSNCGTPRPAWSPAPKCTRTLKPAPSLHPPPAWVYWNHSETGPWPRAEVHGVDLNSLPCLPWLQDVAQRARARLAKCKRPLIIAHADWWSENVRWHGDQLHVWVAADHAQLSQLESVTGASAELVRQSVPERLQRAAA